MRLILRTWQYHPATGAMHLMLEHGLAGGGRFFVHTTKAKLVERASDGTAWCDEAPMLAEAQAAVEKLYPGESLVVALPPRPVRKEAS